MANNEVGCFRVPFQIEAKTVVGLLSCMPGIAAVPLCLVIVCTSSFGASEL